jgi:hypothetical protein
MTITLRLTALIVVATTATAHAQVAARADTTVVMAGAPRYAAGGTLVKLWAIGGNSAPADEYRFSEISGVFATRAGVTWVTDRVASTATPSGVISRTRMYDPAGRFIRQIDGGIVSGRDMAELEDGRVLERGSGTTGRMAGNDWIFDPIFRQRVFRADGTVDTTWVSRDWGSPFSSPSVAVDTSGTLWMSFRRSESSAAQAGGPRVYFTRVRADGRIIDSVYPPTYAPPSDTAAARVVALLGVPPGVIIKVHPFGYLLNAVRSAYAIDLLTASNQTQIVSFRRTLPVVLRTSAELADTRRLLDRIGAVGNRVLTLPPAAKEPIRDIVVAPDGDLWVSIAAPSTRVTAAEAARMNPPRPAPAPSPIINASMSAAVSAIMAQNVWVEPFVFDVFEPGGAYVGQVRFPLDVTPRAFSRNAVWCTVNTVNEPHTLVKYAITWR